MDFQNVYVFVALKRKKENTEKRRHRIVSDGDDEKAVKLLKQIVKGQKGIWRLYRTVNKRNLITAQRSLICELIKNPTKYLTNVNSLWKSILMKKETRRERKWLLDVDTKNTTLLNALNSFLKKQDVSILEKKETINGYHYVVYSFDTRSFNFSFVEIKKDALLFLNIMEGGIND